MIVAQAIDQARPHLGLDHPWLLLERFQPGSAPLGVFKTKLLQRGASGRRCGQYIRGVQQPGKVPDQRMPQPGQVGNPGALRSER